MSQEVDIVVQISSVEQISSGVTTITPQSIGAVPLGQSGRIDSAYLPDQASLDTEVDSKIVNLVKNTNGGTNTDKLVTFNQSGSGENVIVSDITNDGDGYIAGIMGWGNPSGTQWSDLNGTYVKTSVAVTPNSYNNNGMHTPLAGTFNYYLQNPISMGSPNSDWNGIAYFLAPMNRSGWGNPNDNNLTDPPVNYWRLCVGADWPYTYFTNPSTNAQVFPTTGWIPVGASATTPNEGAGNQGADYLPTYGGGFSVALGGGNNSEIGAWGFGVSNGSGSDAYIEPDGLHVEASGKSIFVSNDKVQLDNGAKLRKGTTDAQLGGYKGIALECSAQYELKWEAGRLYTMQQDGVTIRSVQHCMSAPTSADDNTKGFVNGTRWVMDSGKTYVCTNDGTGNADWELKLSLDGIINAEKGASGDANGGNAGIIQQIGGSWANGNIETGSEENGDPIYEIIGQMGGDAGRLIQNGGNGGDWGGGGSAGSIEQNAYRQVNAGNINTSAGENGEGGNIYTSNGGGDINTTLGYIGLGRFGGRTTIQSTAFINKTINLPDRSGTIALEETTPRIVTHKISNVDLGVTTGWITQFWGENLGDIASKNKGYTPRAGYMVSEIKQIITSRYRQDFVGFEMKLQSQLSATDVSFMVDIDGSIGRYIPSISTYIKVDNELMLVTAVSSNSSSATFGVVRGQLGTNSILHNARARVYGFEKNSMFNTGTQIRVTSGTSALTGNGSFNVSLSGSIGANPWVGSIFREVMRPNNGVPSGTQIVRPEESLFLQSYNTPSYLSATISNALSTTDTTLNVSQGNLFSTSGYYARITSTAGTEFIYVVGNVQAGSTYNMSVIRGVSGSSALAHPANATISTNGGSANGRLLADVFVTLERIY